MIRSAFGHVVAVFVAGVGVYQGDRDLINMGLLLSVLQLLVAAPKGAKK